MAMQELINAARTLFNHFVTVSHATPDGRFPSDIVAHGSDVKLESLERFQRVPNRIKQRAELGSAASLCDYVNRFVEEETTLYLDTEEKSFMAVLDHHGPAAPDWCWHRAVYSAVESTSWSRWKSVLSRPLSQRQLADLFEASERDFHEPDPATMLTVATEFEATEKMTYQSDLKLDNGEVKLTYIKAGTGTRSIQFPHRFDLYIPVFENEERLFISMRLRYVVSDGILRFTVLPVRDLREIEYEALAALRDEIVAKVGSAVHVYEGGLETRI